MSAQATGLADGARPGALVVALLDLADGALFILDPRGRINALNLAGSALLGLDGEAALGRSLEELLPLIDARTGRSAFPIDMTARGGIITRIRGESGIFRLDWRAAADDGDANLTLLSLTDETASRALQRRLQQREMLDRQTGVLNREQFEARLDVALATCRAQLTQRHTLVHLAIDHFALIADAEGPAIGDAALRAVAARINQTLRPADVVGRVGDAAFAILVDSVARPQTRRIVERLLRAIGDDPFEVGGRRLEITASAGLVEIQGGDLSAGELLRRGRIAGLRAQEEGRGQVFDGGDEPEGCTHVRQLALAGAVRDALAKGRVALSAQEVRATRGDLSERRYELLLRVKDERGRPLPVGDLICAAERFDLMRQLDRWVVEHVLVELADRIAQHPGLMLSLNLSGSSLGDRDFVEHLLDLVDTSPIDPETLTFEVTETAVLRNEERALDTLAALREAGCSIALDDFGVGLSNFDYLQRFPADFVKIDGSFVRGMADRPRDAAIVESIVALARRLGAKAVLEHVETASLWARAREIGADYVQGHFIGYPRDFVRLLDEMAERHGAALANRQSIAGVRNAMRY